MKIEKEILSFKRFQLKPSPENNGGSLHFDGHVFKLPMLQFSYLETLKATGSIEQMVQFYLRQGWLVQFRELFNLIELLVNQRILLNTNIIDYFRQESVAADSFSAQPQEIIKTSADQLPFFRSLNPDLANHLLQNSRREKVPAQTTLIKSGDHDRDLFILLKGQAQIYRQGTDGKKLRVASLHPGALFGERGFLLNQVRSADIVTSQESEILRVPYKNEWDQFIRTEKAKSLQHRFWILQALSASPLFKDLPGDCLDNLIFAGRLVQAKTGQCLFKEGQSGSTCYIVVQGSIVVSQKGRNINVMNQGACFGEIALMASGGLRTATTTVQNDTILLEINQQNFYQVLAQNLWLARDIEALAAARIEKDRKTAASTAA